MTVFFNSARANTNRKEKTKLSVWFFDAIAIHQVLFKRIFAALSRQFIRSEYLLNGSIRLSVQIRKNEFEHSSQTDRRSKIPPPLPLITHRNQSNDRKIYTGRRLFDGNKNVDLIRSRNTCRRVILVQYVGSNSKQTWKSCPKTYRRLV